MYRFIALFFLSDTEACYLLEEALTNDHWPPHQHESLLGSGGAGTQFVDCCGRGRARCSVGRFTKRWEGGKERGLGIPQTAFL